jgi:hypothetical protein
MSIKLLISFTFAILMAKGLQAQGPSLADVLRSTPKPANVVVYADIAALRKLTEGASMLSDLPDKVREVRMASELSIAKLRPEWEIGYVQMVSMPRAETIASNMGGYIDKMGKFDAIWTPKQKYLVPLDSNGMALVRPTDRKLLGQWLRKERSATQSEFLTTAAAQKLQGLSLMIALDLEDLLSLESLKTNLKSYKSLGLSNINTLAPLLAGVRGVNFQVSRDSLANSSISITFSSPPNELVPVANDVFSELLDRNGASISDFKTWKSRASGNTLTMSGPISLWTIDDVLGIFTLHANTSQVSEPSASETSPSGKNASPNAVVELTKEYFNKVASIIKRVREYAASNTGERAAWNGSMARRIDELPTLNVDPEVVDFGSEIAKSLRNNMLSMQLTNITSGAAAIANNAGTSGFSTAVGGASAFGAAFGAYNDPNSVMNYYAMGQSQGNANFRQLVSQLEQALADMRRRLTDKYQVQF